MSATWWAEKALVLVLRAVDAVRGARKAKLKKNYEAGKARIEKARNRVRNP